MRFALALFVGLMSFWPLAPASQAQQTNSGGLSNEVLVIDFETLFELSLFGQRVLAEQEARTAILRAENRQVAAELAEEEQSLTDARDSMPADEFRLLADAFDARAEEIRAQRNEKEQEIIRFIQDERERFVSEVSPIVTRIMSERGAGIVIERRFAFASRSSLDVTQRALQLSDAILQDGSIDNAIDESPN